MLHVINSESESQGAFEGIDVEEDSCKFFDETGSPLVAIFLKPNKRGRLFGILPWVESGIYSLVPDESCGLPRLLDVWDSIAGLEANVHFATLEEVRCFLTNR
jgi:hypothetical protein